MTETSAPCTTSRLPLRSPTPRPRLRRSKQRMWGPPRSVVPLPTTRCGYPHNRFAGIGNQVVGSPTIDCPLPHSKVWVPPQPLRRDWQLLRRDWQRGCGSPHDRLSLPRQQSVGPPTTASPRLATASPRLATRLWGPPQSIVSSPTH